jgi:cobalt-zinc-cadmium resistance protein CzcA
LAPWPEATSSPVADKSTQAPALRLLATQEALAEQQKRLAAANFGPSVGLGYFNQTLEQVAGFQGVQLTVGIPLVFAGRRAEYRASRYELAAARQGRQAGELSYRYQREQAVREVEVQLDRLNYYRDTAMPRADAILRQANSLFQQGEIEYFEYLQSLDAVLAVKLDQLQLELTYHQALNRLAEINNAYGY